MKNVSTRCEMWEEAISTLADDELDGPEVLATIDHMVGCRQCRQFYHQIRSLGVATLTTEVGRRTPGEELWDRIAARTPEEQPTRVSSFPRMAAVGSIAAAAVLAVGMWTLREPELPPVQSSQVATLPMTAESVIEVELEGGTGSMTESRFIALTTELLQADSRYHEMMLTVMQSAAEAAELPYEGGGSEGGRRTERRDRNRVSVGSSSEGSGFSWEGAAF